MAHVGPWHYSLKRKVDWAGGAKRNTTYTRVETENLIFPTQMVQGSYSCNKYQTPKKATYMPIFTTSTWSFFEPIHIFTVKNTFQNRWKYQWGKVFHTFVGIALLLTEDWTGHPFEDFLTALRPSVLGMFAEPLTTSTSLSLWFFSMSCASVCPEPWGWLWRFKHPKPSALHKATSKLSRSSSLK